MTHRTHERGAAALLVVIFSILLLMTVSLGFMRLVVTDQARTSNDELARGAYDAALAGVEDGKRALLACTAAGDVNACAAINADQCNTIFSAKILSSAHTSDDTGEVTLQTTGGSDGGFDQAYTCVKVQQNTQNIEGTLNSDTSDVKRLRTTSQFTQLDVSWFTKPVGKDVQLDATAPALPQRSAWSLAPEVRPPILRVQLIQYNDGDFNLSDFDEDGGGHTLYLYPSLVGADQTTTNALNFITDARRSGTGNLLQPVACEALPLTQYVCNVRINLPAPVDGSAASRQAYLRVTSIYGDTDYQLQAVGTEFDGVQPAIDSTGRAADVFRRVRARVELTSAISDALFPRATVDITQNFCKNFSVTATNYIDGSCQYDQP